MKCLNRKVIGLLAALGVGTYLVVPGMAAAAVPLLVIAVCPLSKLLMMRAMGSVAGPTPETTPSPPMPTWSPGCGPTWPLRAERQGR